MINKDGLRLGVIGFLLGSLLPAIATFNECARGSGFTWGRALNAQLTSPLLLMLDALPVLLAIWGYFAGSRLGGLKLSKELSQLSVVLVAISIVPLSLFVYVLELDKKSNSDIESERSCNSVRISSLWLSRPYGRPAAGAVGRIQSLGSTVQVLREAYPEESLPLFEAWKKLRDSNGRRGPDAQLAIGVSDQANDLGRLIETKRLARQSQAALELKLGMLSLIIVLAMSLVLLNRLGRTERIVAQQREILENRNSQLEDQREELVQVAEQMSAVNSQLQQMASIVESSEDAIVGASLDGIITSWNRGAESLYGYSRSEILGRSMSLLVPADHPYDVPDLVQKLSTGISVQHYETKRKRRDGSVIDVSLRISGVRDENGNLQGIAKIARDITERRNYEQKISNQMARINEMNRDLQEANERLDDLAMQDALTGLKNHRAFQERLAEEYAKSCRYKTPLSLIMLDMDYFKDYNDSFGHMAGDEVLRKLSELLVSNCRSVDFVARYGGEEFVLLLPVTEEEDSTFLARRLHEAIRDADWPYKPLTASFGIATFDAKNGDASSLLGDADLALYHSKQNGRNRITHAAQLMAQSV